LAEGRGLVSSPDRRRILDVMRRLRLPIWHPLCESGLLREALHDTIRHRDGLQRIPLPVGIGAACFVNDLTVAELSRAAETLCELGRSKDLKLGRAWASRRRTRVHDHRNDGNKETA
ncbi:MAG: hypothetical protein ACRDSF_28815, partial [Pseudonocardiaceae bacterium]